MRQKKAFLASDLRLRCRELSELERENKKLKNAALGPSGAVKEQDSASQRQGSQAGSKRGGARDSFIAGGGGTAKKDNRPESIQEENNDGDSYMGSQNSGSDTPESFRLSHLTIDLENVESLAGFLYTMKVLRPVFLYFMNK